jgi:hypothetical protein
LGLLGLNANTENLHRINSTVIFAFPDQKQLVVFSQLLQEAEK